MRRQRHRDGEFTAFVDAKLRQLVVFGLTLSADEHDAWDLAQEALLRVYARWSAIESPLTYTRQVMVRLNIDQHRRKGHEVLGAAPEVTELPVYLYPPDRRLIEALAQLTPQQRTALAMRYWLDLDVRAVAEMMNCSEGTVRSHLSRGTARLRGMEAINRLRDGE